ncbi:uncharacterized protein MONOS_1011 [Monocercomonoides exilis]|uniref:uncharacterized protein n=1 Tax=Monocercomonoides exilis TaxID=2049356 RepID=UPI00355A5FE5|nr:hypothetical protein MONOS_1011 [Monocercomonoides exilis]|eukprot:MONOS_1011.1-p1 / transcript=MONOS_1011.1 / gene=MONOS_1011 / organism=Monocercomonoides_exilis_PA203 / gene_product=unspecified product / transcript_product=unspecified product / location=Mono_scaffold00017:24225-24933(+) / protein_length=184 / sequence_SO=supercontig / SO=protein_coding / is_pseudo=false
MSAPRRISHITEESLPCDPVSHRYYKSKDGELLQQYDEIKDFRRAIRYQSLYHKRQRSDLDPVTGCPLTYYPSSPPRPPKTINTTEINPALFIALERKEKGVFERGSFKCAGILPPLKDSVSSFSAITTHNSSSVGSSHQSLASGFLPPLRESLNSHKFKSAKKHFFCQNDVVGKLLVNEDVN